MKSPHFLAILFVLLLALPSKAPMSFGNDAPFVLETLWIVADNQWLTNANTALTGNAAGANLKFPNEIPANVSWGGATVTDGNTIATIIVMPVPQTNVMAGGISEHTFRLNMQNNAIIAAAFPDGFHMFRQLSDLFLVSPGITRADVDALNLVEHVFDLQSRAHIGFVQYYPERTLLPTLPPEQEDESDFVKKVRGRSANNYKDGQFTGTVDSFLMGLRVLENNEFRIVGEQRYVEGMEPLNDVASSPFPFGGFVDPDASINMAFRVPFGKEFTEGWLSKPLKIQIGVRVIPPEERENENRFIFNFSTVDWELEEREDYNLIRDGNYAVFYPKQSENRPEEEGVPSNAEWDKINEELARSALPFLANVRKTLLSLDWSQPLDIAVSNEGGIWYLALAYPPVKTQIDWSLASQLTHAVVDYLRRTISPDNPKYDALGAINQVEIKEMPGTLLGLTCYQMLFAFTENKAGIVFAQESGVIYVAIPHVEEGNEVTEEQFAAMQQRLEEKIEASRRGIAEKMPPPRTVLRSNYDGTRFRADVEMTARGYRVSIHVAQESFGNVLALGQQFGVGPSLLLPFLR